MASFATKLMCLFLILGLAAPALAIEYEVGGSAGWSLEANLQLWLNGKTFNVGDVLVFTYDKLRHNVVQVGVTGLSICLPTDIIYSDNSGKTTITLSKAGVFNYVSTVAKDCLDGLKITITVFP